MKNNVQLDFQLSQSSIDIITKEDIVLSKHTSKIINYTTDLVKNYKPLLLSRLKLYPLLKVDKTLYLTGSLIYINFAFHKIESIHRYK